MYNTANETGAKISGQIIRAHNKRPTKETLIHSDQACTAQAETDDIMPRLCLQLTHVKAYLAG